MRRKFKNLKQKGRKKRHYLHIYKNVPHNYIKRKPLIFNKARSILFYLPICPMHSLSIL